MSKDKNTFIMLPLEEYQKYVRTFKICHTDAKLLMDEWMQLMQDLKKFNKTELIK